MGTETNEWKYRRWKLAQLHPNSHQSHLFGSIPLTNNGTDAGGFREPGYIDPIHVLPANKAGLPKGTLLDDWRRIAVYEAAGRRLKNTGTRMRSRILRPCIAAMPFPRCSCIA